MRSPICCMRAAVLLVGIDHNLGERMNFEHGMGLLSLHDLRYRRFQ
jgi:hypothetical protein